jgi:hypothetical protein
MAASAGRSPETKFRYSASARELAGQFAAPIQESPTSDACVLPPAGGYQHLVWSPVNFAGILQMERGYAETLGRFEEKENAWQTTARIALENCNLGDVLTIGRMSAALVSSYPVTQEPPNFSVINAVFADVRVRGIGVQITTNQETYSRPFTHENVKTDAAFRKRSTSNGVAITSYVQSIIVHSGPFSHFYADGNMISVPDFGSIRFGELAVEPERCTLKLLSAEFKGPIRGQLDLGLLSIDGAPGRSTGEEPFAAAKAPEEWAPTSTNLDEEEEAEVLDELNQWVNTHPHKDEPFLFFMGHSLTPVQFFREVQEHTSFGMFFLRFLSDQSKRFREHPRNAIRRAVDANRHE